MRDSTAQFPSSGRPTAGRSLIVLAGGERAAASPGHCPAASPAFLAQLIATAQQVPQLRARCRAAPADASACYAAATLSAAGPPMRGWVL
jgi:hypothetical protein